MVNKGKYLVSIIWGYSTRMYGFAIEENYHLHVLNLAKELGYIPVVVIRQAKGSIEGDPHFDRSIKIINYKNIFNYFFQIIKYSFKGAVFYVNSVEMQSFCVPFLVRRTIFMGHVCPIRNSLLKQIIFNFIMKRFKKIRLNNEEEKKFLLSQGINECKLKVVPLVISNRVYCFNNDYVNRKDVVYFGNVTATKKLDIVLKAFKMVLEKKEKLKLHIVGDILDNKFQKILIDLNLVNDVVFYGFMPAIEAGKFLNKFKICVNASHTEGQCLAVYNASLAGCALCLPNIMSFRGVFKDKALFHEVSDHKKLAENILFYLDKPTIVEGYNGLCRKMIVKEYDYEVVSRKLKELLIF